MDFAIDQPRRPSGSRRRLRGLYSVYLHELSFGYVNDCEDLLTAVGFELPPTASGDSADQPGAVILHRWHHGHSSYHQRLGRRKEELDEPDKPAPALFSVINSSYWMPERADLQPQIAHEAAHLAMKERLAPLFADTQLASVEGSFASLLRTLRYVLVRFGLAPGTPYTRPGAAAVFLPELAADFLAATLVGPAYLFAMTTDLLAADAERLIKLPSGDRALSLFERFRAREPQFSEQLRLEWYCRLRLTSRWINAVWPRARRSALYEPLAMAVDKASEAVLSYLEARADAWMRDDLARWRSATMALESTLEGHRCVSECRDWVERRLRVREPSPGEKVADEAAAWDRDVPRLARPLPTDLSRFLLRVVATRRYGRRNASTGPYRENILLHGEFPELFPARAAPRGAADSLGFFYMLQDITWECLFLRGQDFAADLHRKGRDARAAISRSLQSDFGAGHAPFSIALEIFLSTCQTARMRLFRVLSVVEECLKSEAVADGLADELMRWLHGAGLSLDALVKALENLNNRMRRRFPPALDGIEALEDIARRYGARAISQLTRRSLDGLGTRCTRARRDFYRMRLAGYKLAELERILSRNEESLDAKLLCLLSFLRDHAENKRQVIRRRVMQAIEAVGREKGRVTTPTHPPGPYQVRPVVPMHRDLVFVSSTCAGSTGIPSSTFVGRGAWTTLGRYDALVVHKFHEVAWPLLSGYVSPSGLVDDQLLFEQRSLHLRFSLSPLSSSGDDVEVRTNGRNDPPPPLALVMILLKDRFDRVDFAYRLLRALDMKSEWERRGKREDHWMNRVWGAERAVSSIRPETDVAYFSDGPADIVIGYREAAEPAERKGLAERLLGILSDVIRFHEDDRVHRAELVFFDMALAAVAERPEWFSVRQVIRLRSQGSRVPDGHVWECARRIQERIKNTGLNNTKLWFTPGRADMIVLYGREDLKTLLNRPKDPTGLLRSLYSVSYVQNIVDHVETRIGVDPERVAEARRDSEPPTPGRGGPAGGVADP